VSRAGVKTGLEMDPQSLEKGALEVARLISAFHAASESEPVLRHENPAALAERLGPDLPRKGTDLLALIREVRERVIPSGRRNDSPRFFGYVCSGGSDAGALADFLASGINQNVTAYRSAPAPTEMERLVIDWIRRIIGMPDGSEGLLLGGGSAATLTALAAARDAVAGADVPRSGLITLGREMTLYASDEVHMSVPRAASLLGIGREGLRVIPSTPEFRMDMAALRASIEADRMEGRVPFCVVANAGSTSTGAIDPLSEMAALCEEESLWLHVDAAYGGFALLAPGAAGLLSGLGEADSVAIDPHKWLHVPFDCGALLVRDPKSLRAPFGDVGEYARTRDAEGRSAHAFFEHGPELSRRFRALKVWMMMRHLGLERLGALIDHDLAMARALASRIEESADLELLAPVPLSTVCFRYTGGERDEGALDRLNRRILSGLQEEARVYPTHTEIKGRFAIRACILNPRTTEEDLDLLLSEVRRLGESAAR